MRSLWDSTYALFERFMLVPPFDAQGRKFAEETYEFNQALNDVENMLLNVENFPLEEQERLAEEACNEFADVVVVGMARLMRYGISYDQVSRAMFRVLTKNNAKTPKTHHVESGMIKRNNP